MIATGSLNFLWSQAMVAGFVAAGVTDAVISPGSRSTPLALAMLRQDGLRCEMVVDERSAAFFALGIAKASQRPVLLLATSGTAPANWLPAVIEASQAGVPLILISADRPPELQDCGANQTIDQARLFGAHVRVSHALGTPDADFDPGYLHRLTARIAEQAMWPHPGPVHINQPFREPLVPSGETAPIDLPERIRVSRPRLQPDPAAVDEIIERISGRPGAIICSEHSAEAGFADAVTALAARLDCPVLAEPLSNLRFGAHDRSRLCVHYNTWLKDAGFAEKYRPEWLLHFGAWPVGRPLQNYLASASRAHMLIEPWPRWTDPSHKISHLLRADPLAACHALLARAPAPAPDGWMAAFSDKEAMPTAGHSATHIATLLAELPETTPLFVGNSLAIRQLDSHAGTGTQAFRFFANRGASGIDGNISTAIGIAAMHGSVAALLGDLTCQHDLGGLALAQGRNVVIAAVNNGGGGIFDLLPQAELPEFEQGWRTPQHMSFEHAALTFGLGYAKAEDMESFALALRHAFNTGGPWLIELLEE